MIPIYTLHSKTGIVSGVQFSLFTLACAAGERCCAFTEFFLECTDGTDHQAVTGYAHFAAVNKGGVYTSSVNTSAGPASARSAGTLVATVAVTGAANLFTFKMTATSTGLGVITLFQVKIRISNRSLQQMTLL